MKETFLKQILRQKKREVAAMDLEEIGPKREAGSFYDAVQARPQQMHLIAEVKRASPSKGSIKVDVDVAAQAKSYELAGAGAVSVLTDPFFFKGSIADLKKAADAVEVPVLCKDFIISRKQLIRARNAGAGIVLLIVAALERSELAELYRQALDLSLEVLVEVHDLKELRIAENMGAKLIGVNNRSLHSFEVAISVSEELQPYHSLADTVYISESGFKEAQDVERVAAGYQAVLVGEALMREGDPAKAAEKLKVKRPFF